MLVPLIRTLILYCVVIFAIRFMGKRQVGELQPSELVITILVSAVASVPIQDIEIPLLHGIIPILALVSAEIIISAISQKNIRFRRFFTGNPVLIICDGQFNQGGINKLRLSIDDILASLRLNGYHDIREIKRAQVETNGQISVLLYDEKRGTTPEDLGIKIAPEAPFYTIISDGRLISDNLKSISKSEDWVKKVIKAGGAESTKEVYFLSCDEYGNTIFMKKDAQ